MEAILENGGIKSILTFGIVSFFFLLLLLTETSVPFLHLTLNHVPDKGGVTKVIQEGDKPVLLHLFEYLLARFKKQPYLSNLSSCLIIKAHRCFSEVKPK